MTIKQRFKLTPLFGPANRVYSTLTAFKWAVSGKPLPPPHEIKQRHLIELHKRWGSSILVETGTYRGKMIFAMRPYFDHIISIELADELATRAQQLFASVNTVEIIHGDSATELPRVVSSLDRAAIFWLDGHYSGGETARAAEDSPLRRELSCIFSSPIEGHVIAIDDAHLFNGKDGYPTPEELTAMVEQLKPDYRVNFDRNIVTLEPSMQPGP